MINHHLKAETISKLTVSLHNCCTTIFHLQKKLGQGLPEVRAHYPTCDSSNAGHDDRTRLGEVSDPAAQDPPDRVGHAKNNILGFLKVFLCRQGFRL